MDKLIYAIPFVGVIGLIYAVVYYFVFRFLINRFNLKTPGREADDEETKLYTRQDYNARKDSKANSSDSVSELILKGLGGKGNISDVDCCATRLRITVKDATKVDDNVLKQTGASGVIRKGEGVQIIYGP